MSTEGDSDERPYGNAGPCPYYRDEKKPTEVTAIINAISDKPMTLAEGLAAIDEIKDTNALREHTKVLTLQANAATKELARRKAAQPQAAVSQAERSPALEKLYQKEAEHLRKAQKEYQDVQQEFDEYKKVTDAEIKDLKKATEQTERDLTALEEF